MSKFFLRSALIAAITFLTTPSLTSAQEPNPIPTTFRSIYPQASRARAQVDEAMKLAAQQHKRVILNFGTNQCADCQVLEDFLQEEPNSTQIAEHFLIVNVDVGKKSKQNHALAQRFGIPLQKGIPALSVIDGQGHVVYAQANGEFRNARNMSPEDVTQFLNKWRE